MFDGFVFDGCAKARISAVFGRYDTTLKGMCSAAAGVHAAPFRAVWSPPPKPVIHERYIGHSQKTKFENPPRIFLTGGYILKKVGNGEREPERRK